MRFSFEELLWFVSHEVCILLKIDKERAAKFSFLMVMPLIIAKVAKDLVYDYRGMKIKGTRNEAGWNSVYVAGKIIEKIGPILAINNNEVYNNHVVEKFN